MTEQNRVAVITGASGGLGQAFAENLSVKGYDLLITARNRQKLEAFATSLQKQYGIKVTVVPADLTIESGIELLADAVDALGRVDLLVNTAGFAEGSLFLSKDYDTVKQMMNIHMASVVKLTHVCLPKMKEQNSGAVITVSSLSAYIPAPASSIYASSKAFLNSFMESVYLEVRDYNIQMQSLCPGLTNTGFHKTSGRKQPIKNKAVSFWLEPEDVVRRSFKKLGRPKVVYVPGFMNKLTRLVVKLLPRRIYYNIASNVAKDFNN